MALEATVTSAAESPLVGEVRWRLETDEKVVLEEHSSLRRIAPRKTKLRLEYLPPKPGFYRVTCTLGLGAEEVAHSMLMGYAPEDIDVPLTGQPDLKTFWEEAAAELRGVPPRFRLTPQPERGDETRDVYLVEMRSLGDVRVRGWYEVPRKPGRHPAILRLPGYGQDLRPLGRFEDLCVFSFNVRAHGNSQDDVSGEPVDYWIRGLDDKRDYFYRGAFMDCIRAVDFLVSRDEVDPERIAVMGGSQGGGLSLATAALDHRIRLCAPDIPFLADFVDYFKLTKWPEMDNWVDAQETRTWARTLETLSYFDTMNLAPWIECPVFLGVGLQDPICPARTVFAAFRRVPGAKEYRVYPFAEHHVGPEHRERVYAWVRRHFGVERVKD